MRTYAAIIVFKISPGFFSHGPLTGSFSSHHMYKEAAVAPSPLAVNISLHRVFFPMSQPFALGGQRIGTSASASVLPMNNSGLISFSID